ncbi:MAG: NAD(P)/FAD-dependent oxidoreductase [Candidatus Thorarchaeota archaeon]
MGKYDVVVVGAGPAGSCAAYELAQAGLNTVLLEKAQLPREKPCGGAVMYRGLRLLGRLPRRLAEREVYGLRFILPDGFDAQFKSKRLLGVTTNRSLFDEFLARRAESAGVELFELARVTRVEVGRDGATTVLSDGREFKSQFVVGADGVNTVVGRFLGIRPPRKDLHRVGLGMESDFRVGAERVVEACDGDPTVLQILPVEGRVSYGWVFPKREHLAIGIAGAGVHMHPLRPIFDGFVRQLERRFGFELIPEKRRVWFLGADGVNNVNVTDRVVLVGDAAGYVDPMMGEGIAYAMWSGVYAASVIVEAMNWGRYDAAFLARYEDKCRKAFGANFAMAEWAGTRGTSFAHAVLSRASHLNLSGEILCMLARGEIGYSHIPSVVLRKLPFEIPHILRDMIQSRYAA